MNVLIPALKPHRFLSHRSPRHKAPVTWATPTRVSQEAGALLCKTVNTPDFEHPSGQGRRIHRSEIICFSMWTAWWIPLILDSPKWTYQLPEKMKNPRKRSVFKGLWWSQQDSNLWPHRCERCALPTEPCDLIPNFLAFSAEIVRSFQLPAHVGLVYQWAGHLRYSWTGSLITWPVGSTNWAMRPFHSSVPIWRKAIHLRKVNELPPASSRFSEAVLSLA